MDRPIVYPGAVPADTDYLNLARMAYIGISELAQAVLGTGTLLSGFPCSPASGLSVQVGAGAIYALEPLDTAAYGSLGTSSLQLVKQGLSNGATLNCPAPTTAGQSIAYLVEIAQADQDGTPVVLSFYDSANPTVPYTGPSNSGGASNTVRACTAVVAVKAGTAATTGSQTTPSPDGGYVGAWVVTVPYGANSITSGMIAAYGGAPFISETLNQKISAPTATALYQSGAANYAVDTSTNANTVIVALTPEPTVLTDGLVIRAKVANTSTGSATLTLGGLGNFPIGRNGQGLTPGDLIAGVVYELIWQDGHWDLQSPAPISAEAVSFASYCVDQGSAANQIVAIPLPMPATLEDGLSLRVRAAHTSTGAAILTLGGLGAAPILSRGMGLYPGALQAGLIYAFTYNLSLSAWEVQSQTCDRIIKTGTATLPSSGQVTTNVTVTFDAPFPDGVDHVSITPQAAANSSMGGNATTRYGNANASGFTIAADTNTGELPTNQQITFNQAVPVTWVAFGH